ncbi:MAG: glycerophosphodiester phosphodiesterase [Acidimicrobiia bacterium]|nr:glycerophosphodiester phosphodiesterase [Acidimicrobiia bacterium]
MAARVIAHRGAPTRRDGSRIRENTLEAFERAMELGADGIDFDVRRTSDDVLVVHHDVHLDDGRQLREIHSSELPDWLPTLAEALEICSDTWLNIEVKNLPGDPDYDETFGISLAVAALVQAFHASDRVHVSSFDFGSVQRIRENDPSIRIRWIVWGQANPTQMVVRAAGTVDAVHPSEMLVDRTLMAMCKEAKLEVITWTVNDPIRLVELHGLRVDGIVTDQVAMARNVLYGE